MSATVYTTAGGRRFHAVRSCRALESGRALSEVDCGCDEFCYHRLPTTHLPRKRSNLAAALLGYTACRVCVPTADALPSTGETYGHEPVRGLFPDWLGEWVVCARCEARRSQSWVDPENDDVRVWRFESPVPWPCTSAVVLGLAPREAAA